GFFEGMEMLRDGVIPLREVENIVKDQLRILSNPRREPVGVGRNKIQSTHRRRCPKPRRKTMSLLVEAQRHLGGRAPNPGLLFENELLHVLESKLAGVRRRGHDLLQIHSEEPSHAFCVSLLQPAIEW